MTAPGTMDRAAAHDVDVCHVTVRRFAGEDGFGWYVWESEYPEEGYFWFGETRPTADDLRAICPSYVEEPAAVVPGPPPTQPEPVAGPEGGPW